MTATGLSRPFGKTASERTNELLKKMRKIKKVSIYIIVIYTYVGIRFGMSPFMAARSPSIPPLNY
jgi:hypothetical protein